MAYDLALNAKTHDLQLTPQNGLHKIDSAERVAQQIKITLLAFLGEWFLDIAFGIPYLEQVLVKNTNLTSIRSIFIAKVKDVPGVIAVSKMDLYFDRKNRRLSVYFEADTDYGLITRREVLGYGTI